MSEPPIFQTFLERDGTSQSDRLQAALDPDSVAIDERSLQDLLAFAQRYAEELRYVDPNPVAGGTEAEPANNWQAFFKPDFDRSGLSRAGLDLDEVVAFMQAPDTFTGAKARFYSRPHFVLFLTFLQLLRRAQDHLNTLTRRHLDFYYQQVLEMVKKPGRPDRVNVLVDLAPDTANVHLPAGTLLDAGTDSQGQALVYRLDQDIVANQAHVARVSSVYADQRITGIREAREFHTGTDKEAFIKMLEIALGDPEPGDRLPGYPHKGADATVVDILVNHDFIQKLRQLKNSKPFIINGL